MKKFPGQLLQSIFNCRRPCRPIWFACVLAWPFLGGLGCRDGLFNYDAPADLAFQIQECPADITVTAPDVAGANVSFTLPGVTYDATKVFAPTVEVVSRPQSGSFFPIGKTQVTILATLKGSNNPDGKRPFTAHATCSFSVTVKPNIPDQTCTPASGSAPTPGFTWLANFLEGELASIDMPLSLIEGCDGNLYGVTVGGGQIIRLDKQGGSARILFSFNGNGVLTNQPPMAGLARVREVGADGLVHDVFLGMTPRFYISDHAQIFRINADGTGLAVLHDFQYPGLIGEGINQSMDGSTPVGRLVSDKNGFIYGTCSSGGAIAPGRGTAFKMFYTGSAYSLLDIRADLSSLADHPSGSGIYPMGTPAFVETTGDLYVPLDAHLGKISSDTAFSNLADFDWSGYGYNHSGCLLAGNDGTIYGRRGKASSGDPTTPGSIYKYEPTTGEFTVIAKTSDSFNPSVFSLTQTIDGWVYAIADGKLVRFTRAGQLEPVHQFVNEESPTGALLAASDGAIYGTVWGAGPNRRGAMFRYYAGSPAPASATSDEPPKQVATPIATASAASETSISAPMTLPSGLITVATNIGGLNAGRSLAMQGDLLFVGVPFGIPTDFPGAVQIFRRTGTDWNLESRLLPSSSDNAQFFGYSLAVSRDTLVVGAPGNLSSNSVAGSVYVFRQQGTNWSREALLRGNAGTNGDEFGFSVAVNADSLIVGAPGYPSAGAHSGAAFIFQRTNTVWIQHPILTSPEKAALDYFGQSVAINGTAAVVGAPRGRGLEIPSKSGAAYSFTRSGSTWHWTTRLLSSTRYNGDLFGTTVAAGDNYFVVGAPGPNPTDNTDSKLNLRVACVFTNVQTSFPNTITESARLSPAASAPFEMFGLTVSADGPRIRVGAPLAIEVLTPLGAGGAAYVFDRHGYHWTQVGRLASPDGQRGDAFGAIGAVSSNWVAVAAFAHANTNAASGTSYLFEIPLVTAPTLSLTRLAPLWRVCWQSDFTGYSLEYNTNLASTNWLTVLPRPVTNYYDFSATTNAMRFFRLQLK